MDRLDRVQTRVAQVPPLAWAGAMIVVVVVLGLAATTITAVERFDASVVRELQGEVAVRGVEEHVFAVTDLGGDPLLLVGVAAVLTLLLVRRWRAALAVALAVILTKVTVWTVKELVERPRPETALESHGSFSFPSGHAASAAALYLTFAVLLSRGHSALVRATTICLGALVTFAVGASRVLLGAHHPTDVVAGWLVGGLLGICAAALVVRLAGHPRRPDESTGERLKDVVVAREHEPPRRAPDDATI